ncbi:MAG: hypothetical protein M3430_07095 [Acidobacteriota bacterium]|nr:hypothetical protein [Acidobacteriota bacterium]
MGDEAPEAAKSARLRGWRATRQPGQALTIAHIAGEAIRISSPASNTFTDSRSIISPALHMPDLELF